MSIHFFNQFSMYYTIQVSGIISWFTYKKKPFQILGSKFSENLSHVKYLKTTWWTIKKMKENIFSFPLILWCKQLMGRRSGSIVHVCSQWALKDKVFRKTLLGLVNKLKFRKWCSNRTEVERSILSVLSRIKFEI